MKFPAKILIIFSWLGFVCGKEPWLESRIVGGHRVKPHSIPFHVGISKVSNYWIPYCSGVLISDEFVLTSAQCVLDQLPALLNVIVGEHNVTQWGDGEQYLRISEILIHPEFENYIFLHDLALLRLEEKVELSEWVQTICLPSNKLIDYEGVDLKISGWGKMSLKWPPSVVLRAAVVQGVSLEMCQESFPDEQISSNQICARKDGVDFCDGDEGGPLTAIENGVTTLVGIISWTFGCADPLNPGVYARVSAELNWIMNNSNPSLCKNNQ